MTAEETIKMDEIKKMMEAGLEDLAIRLVYLSTCGAAGETQRLYIDAEYNDQMDFLKKHRPEWFKEN